MASSFSFWLAFTFDAEEFILVLWLSLLTATGIFPIAQGIIVGCVPKFAQNSASALYCICQNILALSVAPVLSAYIMDQYDNRREGMIAGYRVLLLAGLVLLTLFVIARSIVKAHIEALKAKKKAEMRIEEQRQGAGLQD